jgi:hypothetical protein
MAAGNYVTANGFILAANADWKALEEAVDASTVPAC